MKLKILISESTNPWFNLATEDWIFHDLQDFDHILFLWRNNETVVIGRSQNPWAECNLEKMQRDHVRLARRQSGGGAVFHDLGNTNFTFLSRKTAYNKSANFSVIVDALKTFGIEAKLSGRNDLVIDVQGAQRKISGSAFKEKGDRAFHHGTLLIQANLDLLQEYLNPNPKKLQAKGIASVRSRVMNLNEINRKIQHENLSQAIIEAFKNYHHAQATPEILNQETLRGLALLNERYENLRSWDWLYGQTLPFTHHFEERFDWGSIEIQMLVQNAEIKETRIYSDSLFPDMIDALSQVLKGLQYGTQTMSQAIQQVKQQFYDLEAPLLELETWLLREMK